MTKKFTAMNINILNVCRCEFLGHVHKFQSYSFGHPESVKWTFLVYRSIFDYFSGITIGKILWVRTMFDNFKKHFIFFFSKLILIILCFVMFILLMSDVWTKFTTAFTSTSIGFSSREKYLLPCIVIRPQVSFMCVCGKQPNPPPTIARVFHDKYGTLSLFFPLKLYMK